MSMRISASPLSKSSLAKTFASCVLPTPVCPKNIKDPIGLLGSFSPARFLWMAFTTLDTASSWPMTLPLISSGKTESLLPSVCAMRLTGTPVIIETTSATFSSVTISLLSLDSASHFSWASERLFSSRFSSSRSFAASSYFCFLTTEFLVALTASNSTSSSTIWAGTSMLVICTLDPASSKASMALSGRKRSDIYRLVSFTQARMASSV